MKNFMALRRPLFFGFLAFWLSAASQPLRGTEVSLADAVARTLRDEPGVSIQQESVRNAEGVAQTASGQFDWNVTAGGSNEHTSRPNAPFAGPLGVLHRESGTASFGLGRQYRSGIIVEPLVTISDLHDNATVPTRAAYSELSVQIAVPLLRGFGRASAAAFEATAQAGLEGQREAARFAIENEVYATLAAFWNAAAARETLAAIREIAARGRAIAAVVDAFTRAGIMDVGIRSRAEAQVADYDRQGIDAELSYFQARQTLGRAMGLTLTELPDPPSPAGALPPPLDHPPDASLAPKFAAESIRRRGDYQALKKSAEQARILARKAELDLRPQLDLSAQFGYAGGADSSGGRTAGAARSLSENLAGPNGLVMLSLAWPVANNVARGTLVSRRAQLRITQATARQAGQTIVSDVLVSFAALQAAFRDYELASGAAAKYRAAADSENDKVRRGQSSLNDLISVEQGYVAARLAAIAAQRDCALAVARIRLASGLLAVESAQDLRFDLRQISELPNFATNPEP